MQKHINNGNCQKCDEILNRYQGFDAGLRAWFKALQKLHSDAHISDAGRGKKDQEKYKNSGNSRANYGQSAHNYNAAIDIFRQTLQGLSYDTNWFKEVVGEAIDAHNNSSSFKLEWYGAPNAKFKELPHVQLANWKNLNLKLVE